ncbi:acetyl-CoA carboxylase carboxyltransferase subunit alpha [Candidatus Margulisiibacteriota bacterium]
MSKADIKGLLEFEKPLTELYKKIDDLKKLSKSGKIDLGTEIDAIEERIERQKKDIFSNLTPLQIVQVARHIQRPTALEYINYIFDDFVELHGDRHYADDPALVGGIAKLDGRSVLVMGHQKGHTTKENIEHNFGMANPEGYRKALRLMEMADTFGKPIVVFIDTPGAYPGIEAEEHSQSEAIARNLMEMSHMGVPIICIVTGEGGSGGALGVGVGNRVLILEFGIYSVISPEGCASILFRDAKKANIAAERQKITAKDLLEMKVVDDIIKEPVGGAHNDPKEAAKLIKAAIKKYLKKLSAMSREELADDRYKEFRKMGIFEESEPA